jgi:hypothetical protein
LGTGSGSNTVNVLNTSAGVPIEIMGPGQGTQDTVNVGSGGNVQGISAPV